MKVEKCVDAWVAPLMPRRTGSAAVPFERSGLPPVVGLAWRSNWLTVELEIPTVPGLGLELGHWLETGH